MRILLAIDDSKFSEAAVEAVIEQARPHGIEVRILHVVEPPPLLVGRELGGYEPALQDALEFQKQHAEALVAKTAELLRVRGLKATAALEVGDPKSKILDAAEEWRSEEHTSELQSRLHLVCRLLLEKKKNTSRHTDILALVSISETLINDIRLSFTYCEKNELNTN